MDSSPSEVRIVSLCNSTFELLISTDLIRAEPSVLTSNSFKPGVTFPSNQWRELRGGYLSSHAEHMYLDGSTIFVLKIDAAILHEAQHLSVRVLKRAEHYSQYENTLRDAGIASVGIKIGEAVAPCLDGRGKLSDWVPAITYKHLIPSSSVDKYSTTIDSRTRCGLRGLHVDNWQQPRLALKDRSRAGYKLLYNFGTECRSFVFIDGKIDQQAQNALDKASRSTFEYWAAGQTAAAPFAEHLLSSASKPHIYRISYPPGTCVIAPVQNLLHDGYPGSMQYADLCMQGSILQRS